MPKTSDGSLTLRKQVADVLAQLRPAVQGDGGDIELVEVDDRGVVSVRLHGACIGCPSASMTLKMGVERALKEQIQGIQEVVCVG